MPWGPEGAEAKTKKADAPAKGEQRASTADGALESAGDKTSATRIASSAVAKHPSHKSPRKDAGTNPKRYHGNAKHAYAGLAKRALRLGNGKAYGPG
jgi:hypothetical protein